ncbi:MAG: hypothetical protein U1E65_25900 [Myxococcota bacterium]
MAKDGNNELSDLFKQALDDEETRHASGAGAKSGKPSGPANKTKPPAKVNTPAARAPTAALPTTAPSKSAISSPTLPATGLVSETPQRALKPTPRGPSQLEGLVAIPKSEANTVGRVGAYEPSKSSGRPTRAPVPSSIRGGTPKDPEVSIPPQTSNPPSTARTGSPSATIPPTSRNSLVPGAGGTGSIPAQNRNRTNASEIRGKPASELTVPPGEMVGESLDHKGRSRPMYAPRTPRPQQKRMNPALDLLLGLFPGARLMARERVASGLAYSIVGLFALMPALVVAISWSARKAAITKLSIDPTWLVLHAALAVISVLLYELVRSASSMNGVGGGVRISRWLAALLFPSLLIVLVGPRLVELAPQAVEPAWLVAIPMLAAGILASVDAARAKNEVDPSRRITGLVALFLGIALVGGLLGLAISVDLNATLATEAQKAGFVKLPQLVRAVRFGT